MSKLGPLIDSALRRQMSKLGPLIDSALWRQMSQFGQTLAALNSVLNNQVAESLSLKERRPQNKWKVFSWKETLT